MIKEPIYYGKEKVTIELLKSLGFVINSNYHPEGPGYKKVINYDTIHIYPLYKMIDIYINGDVTDIKRESYNTDAELRAFIEGYGN